VVQVVPPGALTGLGGPQLTSAPDPEVGVRRRGQEHTGRNPDPPPACGHGPGVQRSAMDDVVTIGVYGWTLDGWRAALAESGVDEVWDVRDRRGLRGAADRWANGNVLEGHLKEWGVGYRHVRPLAPPTPLRSRLQEDDKASGLRHRDRTTLPAWFISEYRSAVLADLEDRLDELGIDLAMTSRPALLCVEGPATACHRSLLGAALAETGSATRTPLPVAHLTPQVGRVRPVGS
jgi:hypothetical protein